MKYRRITIEQRLQMKALLDIGLSKTRVAAKLGLHRSSIGRELRRNTGGRGYRPQQAQRLYEERQGYRWQARRMLPPMIELWKRSFGCAGLLKLFAVASKRRAFPTFQWKRSTNTSRLTEHEAVSFGETSATAVSGAGDVFPRQIGVDASKKPCRSISALPVRRIVLESVTGSET